MKYFHNRALEGSQKSFLGPQVEMSSLVLKPTEPQVPLAREYMTHCFRTQLEKLENSLCPKILLWICFLRYLHLNVDNFHSFYGLFIKITNCE